MWRDEIVHLRPGKTRPRTRLGRDAGRRAPFTVVDHADIHTQVGLAIAGVGLDYDFIGTVRHLFPAVAGEQIGAGRHGVERNFEIVCCRSETM